MEYGRNIYENREVSTDLWLDPSEYIDIDNPVIIEKAEELTAGLQTQDEKIRAILDFVYFEIEYKLVRGTAKDFKPAFESLTDGLNDVVNDFPCPTGYRRMDLRTAYA